MPIDGIIIPEATLRVVCIVERSYEMCGGSEGSATSLKSCRPSLKSSLYFGEILKSEISLSKNAGFLRIFADSKRYIQATCFYVVRGAAGASCWC